VRLRAATRARIEAFFAGMHSELSRLLKETSGLLSDITHYPAVVLGPGLGAEKIVGLHLVPLASRVLLAVMVGESGRVTREVVRLGHLIEERHLRDAEVRLEECYSGRSVSEGYRLVRGLSAGQQADTAGVIVKAVARTLRRSETETRDVYLGGTSQLAELWQDLANVQRVLLLLEQEHAVRAMMGDDEDGTSVRIGRELDIPDVDLAVVSTAYEAGEHGSGRVGVLGPMRMDYRRTIKVVEEVGEGLADSLGS
jgi:heat-inducible transcriptional repressor